MPSQALNPILFSYLKRNFEKLSESSKGVAGGVAALDSNNLVPVANIPPLSYLTSAILGANLGAASLGADGKIVGTQLPAIAITDTFTVASQTAMLALTAQTGDVAVRSDLNKTFILQGADPTVLAGWVELLTPTNTVTSVNGQTGAVTIDPSLMGDTVSAKTFNGAVTCNYSTEGSYVAANVTGATTLTITGIPDSVKAYGMTFELTNAGTNITWPASVSWLGTAPTLRASGVSIVTLITRNGGTTWYGSAA